jgi:hypothetical protein
LAHGATFPDLQRYDLAANGHLLGILNYPLAAFRRSTASRNQQ